MNYIHLLGIKIRVNGEVGKLINEKVIYLSSRFK